MEPQSRYGQFQMEVRGTGNGDNLRLGRTVHQRSRPEVARLQVDVRGRRHLYDAGNRLSILEPLGAVGHVQRRVDPRAQRADDVSRFVGGQSTALRNVFGTDPDGLGQTLAIARASYQASDRLQLNGARRTRAHVGPRRVRPHRRRIGSGRLRRAASSPTRCGSSSPTDRTCTIARPARPSYVSDYSYLAARTCCCRADGFRSTRHASRQAICPS